MALADEHADTCTLLVETLLVNEHADSLAPLMAAEAGRCTAMRSLMSLTVEGEIIKPTEESGPALISSAEHLVELMGHITNAKGEGTLLFYSYLEAEEGTPPSGQLDGATAAADVAVGAEAGGETVTKSARADQASADQLVLWVIDGSGKVVLTRRMRAVCSDGRSLDQVISDVHSKASLAFDGVTTRGPVVTPESSTARIQDLKARGVATDADTSIDTPDSGLPTGPRPVSLDPELQLLFELLIQPAVPYLIKDAPLVLIPHMVLQLVPFTALHSADGGPLIDAHPITTAPSLSILRTLIARSTIAAAKVADIGTASLVVGDARPASSFELPPLPFTKIESVEIAACLKSEPLLADAATARAVGSEMASKPFCCIHLACHSRPRCLAFAPLISDATRELVATAHTAAEKAAECCAVDGEESDAAKAAFAAYEAASEAAAAANAEMQAAEQLGPIADGLLMIESLSQLPLHGHPTVVLAGSHSGAGHVSHDSVNGLPRLFLCAGARSVLSCAWDAADEATSHLMRAFHKALAADPTLSQAEALRQAINSTRKAEAGRWAHPAYWASFTLIGASKGI